MQYLATFKKDDNGTVLVTFPDLPEAITGGADEAEALANAQEALELALLNHVALGEALPEPTTQLPKGGRYFRLQPGAHTQAKMAFISAFVESGLTRVALAAKLGKAENQVRRMLDPHHATKLPALEAGLRAVGKRMVIGVEAA